MRIFGGCVERVDEVSVSTLGTWYEAASRLDEGNFPSDTLAFRIDDNFAVFLGDELEGVAGRTALGVVIDRDFSHWTGRWDGWFRFLRGCRPTLRRASATNETARTQGRHRASGSG